MKRYKSVFSIILTLAILFSSIPLSAQAADNDSSYVFGDANLDGKTTVKDVTYIQRHIANILTMNDNELKAGDADKNGKISIYDATLVQMYIAGTYKPEISSDDEPSTSDQPSTGDEPTTTEPTATEPTTIAPPVAVISKPQWVTVKDRTTNSVTLSWKAVSGADKYRISKEVNGEEVLLGTVASNVTTYKVNNLADGELNTYLVSACKGLAFSEPAAIKASALPGEVKNVKATNNKTNSITVTWSRLVNADGYCIYKKDRNTNGAYIKYATVEGNVASYTDTNVEPGCEVRYVVKGVRTSGSVPELQSYSYTVLITATLPNKVESISFSNITSSGVKLSWSTPKGGRTGYRVYRAQGSGKYTQIAQLGATATSFTDKGLTGATTYKYAVKAYTTVNSTDYNAAYPEQTVKTKLNSLGSLAIASSSTSAIKLKWGKVSNANGYIVYRKTGSAGYAKAATINSGATLEWTDKNVKGGVSYTYKVAPFIKENNKAVESGAKEIKAVAGLHSTDFKFSTIVSRVKLSWNKNPYATGYAVYYSDVENGSYSSLGTTTGTSFLTRKLTPNKKYYFKVIPYRITNGVKCSGTTVVKSFTPKMVAYDKTVPNTYVEINIAQQHMWYYVDGKLYCDTDVVTGNYGTHDTTKGYHKIINKASPATLVGADYETQVSYWMGVTYDGIGIHDSTWRSDSEYGGNTYKGDGSHGCINTPYDKVKKMYNKMTVKTPVIIY